MTTIIIQPQFMPIATFTGQNGKSVPVYVTNEWRRPLEQMAQQLAEAQGRILALTARIEALEA